MRLPVELEQKLAEDIRRIEEEHKMQYITSIERLAREDGREDGLSEGLSEGQQRQARRTLQIQLARRFGAVPGWAEERIHSAGSDQLEAWALRVLDEKSVEEVLVDQE